MNRLPRTELQRRDIAEIAGITPALVNYYFPDKWQLLEAASRPVIESYVLLIDKLIASSGKGDLKLQDLVHLYISFIKDNGYLLDYYMQAINQLEKAEGVKLLWQSHAKIVSYLREAVASGHIRDVNPELLNAVLWSVCKYVALQPAERDSALFPNDMAIGADAHRANAVYDLLLKGLQPTKV